MIQLVEESSDDKRTLREMYAVYVAGRIPFEEVTQATDRAVEAFEASRRRSGNVPTPPSDSDKRSA